MWIMVAGPYKAGAKSDQDRADNLKFLNDVAAQVFDRGHIPIIGVNIALPVINAAAMDRFDDMMMPISLAAAERCDACLRVGGESKGADEEVERFRAKGLPIYNSLADVPADKTAN